MNSDITMNVLLETLLRMVQYIQKESNILSLSIVCENLLTHPTATPNSFSFS